MYFKPYPHPRAWIPVEGAEYELGFDPGYDWSAVVSRCIPYTEIEFDIICTQKDWNRTRVGFHLEEKEGITQIHFHHLGWPEANDHYHTSCYCWAMHLRLLKRYVEYDEVVPYEDRLDV